MGNLSVRKKVTTTGRVTGGIADVVPLVVFQCLLGIVDDLKRRLPRRVDPGFALDLPPTLKTSVHSSKGAKPKKRPGVFHELTK